MTQYRHEKGLSQSHPLRRLATGRQRKDNSGILTQHCSEVYPVGCDSLKRVPSDQARVGRQVDVPMYDPEH